MIDPTAVLAAVNSWPSLLGLLALLGWSAWNSWRGRRDTRVIREHTENEHADHPTPNMRAQMDASDARQARIEAKVDNLATLFGEHAESDAAWKGSVEHELAHRRRPLLSWRY